MEAINERLSNKINTLVAQYDDLVNIKSLFQKLTIFLLKVDKSSTTIQQLEKLIS